METSWAITAANAFADLNCDSIHTCIYTNTRFVCPAQSRVLARAMGSKLPRARHLNGKTEYLLCRLP